jgi:hypothetical protein
MLQTNSSLLTRCFMCLSSCNVVPKNYQLLNIAERTTRMSAAIFCRTVSIGNCCRLAHVYKKNFEVWKIAFLPVVYIFDLTPPLLFLMRKI